MNLLNNDSQTIHEKKFWKFILQFLFDVKHMKISFLFFLNFHFCAEPRACWPAWTSARAGVVCWCWTRSRGPSGASAATNVPLWSDCLKVCVLCKIIKLVWRWRGTEPTALIYILLQHILTNWVSRAFFAGASKLRVHPQPACTACGAKRLHVEYKVCSEAKNL